MNKLSVLLGTTAIVGAGLLVAAPAPAQAATVMPGGALDLTITGRIRTKAFGGDLQEARLNNTISNGLDFASDARFDLLVRGRHDGTGMEYGGNLILEAEGAAENNTSTEIDVDEEWIFMRGGFGEFRFGDDDAVSDDDKVGGFSVAAGTGGIDGSIVDVIAQPVVGPSNSGDSTKVTYRSPSFGGLSVNVSYAPNLQSGDTIANEDVTSGDYVEGSILFRGSLGGLDILASLVGGICDIKSDQGDTVTSDTCRTVFGGATINLWGFKLGGGYGSENLAGTQRDWANAGIGIGFGPANFSVTYGQIIDGDATVNGNEVEDSANLVVSADVGLMPGLILQGDVGFFDNDAGAYAGAANDGCGGCGDTDDDGYQAVGRLVLNF